MMGQSHLNYRLRLMTTIFSPPRRLLPLFVVALLGAGGAASATLVVQVGQNFTGSTYGVNTFSRPADGDGAVGPAHFVELINGRFAIYAKADGTLLQSTDDVGFWQNSGIVIPSGQ